jgi:hypothetical protein
MLLEIEHVTKRYGHAVVVKDLSMGGVVPAPHGRSEEMTGSTRSRRCAARFVAREGGGRWRFKR